MIPRKEISEIPNIDIIQNNSADLLRVGQDYFKKEDYSSAFTLFELLAEKETIGLILIAKLYRQPPFKNIPLAIRYMQQAINRRSLTAINEMGLLLTDEGRHEEARRYYFDAANKDYVPGYCNMAKMYAHGCGVERDLSKASTYYQIALSKMDSHSAIYLQTSAKLIQLGRTPERLINLSDEITAHDLYELGVNFYKNNLYGKALTCFDKAILWRYAPAYHALAVFYEEVGLPQWDDSVMRQQAELYFQKAENIGVGPYELSLLGLLYFELKKPEKAHENIELALIQNNMTAYREMGEIFSVDKGILPNEYAATEYRVEALILTNQYVDPGVDIQQWSDPYLYLIYFDLYLAFNKDEALQKHLTVLLELTKDEVAEWDSLVNYTLGVKTFLHRQYELAEQYFLKVKFNEPLFSARLALYQAKIAVILNKNMCAWVLYKQAYDQAAGSCVMRRQIIRDLEKNTITFPDESYLITTLLDLYCKQAQSHYLANQTSIAKFYYEKAQTFSKNFKAILGESNLQNLTFNYINFLLQIKIYKTKGLQLLLNMTQEGYVEAQIKYAMLLFYGSIAYDILADEVSALKLLDDVMSEAAENKDFDTINTVFCELLPVVGEKNEVSQFMIKYYDQIILAASSIDLKRLSQVWEKSSNNVFKAHANKLDHFIWSRKFIELTQADNIQGVDKSKYEKLLSVPLEGYALQCLFVCIEAIYVKESNYVLFKQVQAKLQLIKPQSDYEHHRNIREIRKFFNDCMVVCDSNGYLPTIKKDYGTEDPILLLLIAMQLMLEQVSAADRFSLELTIEAIKQALLFFITTTLDANFKVVKSIFDEKVLEKDDLINKKRAAYAKQLNAKMEHENNIKAQLPGIDSLSPKQQVQLGKQKLATKEVDAAIFCFENAARRNSYEAFNALALIELEKNPPDYQESQKLLERSMAIKINHTAVAYLAATFYGQGEYRKAREYYEWSYSLGNHAALNKIAEMLCSNNRSDADMLLALDCWEESAAQNCLSSKEFFRYFGSDSDWKENPLYLIAASEVYFNEGNGTSYYLLMMQLSQHADSDYFCHYAEAMIESRKNNFGLAVQLMRTAVSKDLRLTAKASLWAAKFLIKMLVNQSGEVEPEEIFAEFRGAYYQASEFFVIRKSVFNNLEAFGALKDFPPDATSSLRNLQVELYQKEGERQFDAGNVNVGRYYFEKAISTLADQNIVRRQNLLYDYANKLSTKNTLHTEALNYWIELSSEKHLASQLKLAEIYACGLVGEKIDVDKALLQFRNILSQRPVLTKADAKCILSELITWYRRTKHENLQQNILNIVVEVITPAVMAMGLDEVFESGAILKKSVAVDNHIYLANKIASVKEKMINGVVFAATRQSAEEIGKMIYEKVYKVSDNSLFSFFSLEKSKAIAICDDLGNQIEAFYQGKQKVGAMIIFADTLSHQESRRNLKLKNFLSKYYEKFHQKLLIQDQLKIEAKAVNQSASFLRYDNNSL